MLSGLLSIGLFLSIFSLNLKLPSFVSSNLKSPLICVNNHIKYLSFGNNSQIADLFWIRFLQELDAYNQLTIAEPHLCPDKTSSWHFHIMNVAFDLDKKFYEVMAVAPLLISVTIGDSVGSSKLFDKAVENFPDSWVILYRASYQAQVEEKNNKKAADLLYRAGKNGAPPWVLSLAGGLYNEEGDRRMAEQIYNELLKDEKDEAVAARLKQKLDNKLKNLFKPVSPSELKKEK
jgi:hypothetical protein